MYFFLALILIVPKSLNLKLQTSVFCLFILAEELNGTVKKITCEEKRKAKEKLTQIKEEKESPQPENVSKHSEEDAKEPIGEQTEPPAEVF